jgi:hypothetical protein
MRIADSGGASGTIVVDIGGVRRASGLLADDAQAFQELATRVRGHALPSMPDGVAGQVTATIGEVGSGLAGLMPGLVSLAKELRVRAFWAEIADKLSAGYDLQGAELNEFKAAYASGLLTRYAEPWESDLAKAYAKKLYDQEHPGGFMGFLHDVGNFFVGAWDGIKDPAVMIYHLSPLSGPSFLNHWDDLAHGLAYGVTHPVAFGEAVINLDGLQKRGFSYWIGNLAPAVAATFLSGGVAAGVRGADGIVAVDRAAEGATALDRAAEGAADLERVEAAASKPEWLQRLQDGNAFNEERRPFYEHSELYVDKPGGSGYYRVDSYDTDLHEIVSRKYTQFGDVTDKTGVGYVKELAAKYPPGTRIADVPSTPEALRGDVLRGKMVLEVPPQTEAVPTDVLREADRLHVVIRDTDGHVYNGRTAVEHAR